MIFLPPTVTFNLISCQDFGFSQKNLGSSVGAPSCNGVSQVVLPLMRATVNQSHLYHVADTETSQVPVQPLFV